MNIKQGTTELITEESSKPNMPHQLVRDNFANVLAAHQSICDKVNLPIESYPRTSLGAANGRSATDWTVMISGTRAKPSVSVCA